MGNLCIHWEHNWTATSYTSNVLLDNIKNVFPVITGTLLQSKDTALLSRTKYQVNVLVFNRSVKLSRHPQQLCTLIVMYTMYYVCIIYPFRTCQYTIVVCSISKQYSRVKIHHYVALPLYNSVDDQTSKDYVQFGTVKHSIDTERSM